MTDAYVKFRNEVMAGGTDTPDAGGSTGGVRAVVGIGVIVALLVWLGFHDKWQLVFAIGLLVSIFLHELGHFLTAKWTGMKATQFFIFMGPKLFSFRRGETEYGVRAYPVGAFVRIIGMNNLDEVAPEDESRAYRNKSFPRRLLVITAGSLMHVLIAIALLFGVYAIKGTRVAGTQVTIDRVLVDGAAAKAGVKPDSVVVSIDGLAPTTPAQFTEVIRAHHPGDEVKLLLRDQAGAATTYSVVLGEAPCRPGIGFLGVNSGVDVFWQSTSLATAATRSVTDLGHIMWGSVGGVVKVANPKNILDHLTDSCADPNTQPSTLVGATRFSSEIGSDAGFGGILLALAGLNVFIGLFNMIPLLPFDGGHAAMAVYERLRSKPGKPYHADVRKLIPVSMATIAFLGFLFFAALYLDIARPVR